MTVLQINFFCQHSYSFKTFAVGSTVRLDAQHGATATGYENAQTDQNLKMVPGQKFNLWHFYINTTRAKLRSTLKKRNDIGPRSCCGK